MNGTLLTEGLQNYLRVIFELSQKKKAVRIKDIVAAMKVKDSSVTEAVRLLKRKGLVEHEPYGYVELTEKGLREAAKLLLRFRNIKKFFANVLSASDKRAQEIACAVEHALDDETVKAMNRLRAFLKLKFGLERPWLELPFVEELPLNELLPGQQGVIKEVGGASMLKRRLLEMGLIPGEKIEVLKIAPLGDPMEVRVKGYLLSLRKEEAESVLVEVKE